MTKIAQVKREHEQDKGVDERNDEQLTRVATATAKASSDVARETMEVAQSNIDASQGLYETTTRTMAKESPEFGRAFAELLGEQTRQSVDTLSAFARAVNWTDVAQAQTKLMASSFVRISQFNARYGEFLARGMTAIPTFSRR